MHALFLWSALVLGADVGNPALAGGTLLFLENCNSVVQVATRDKIGHVAIVMADDNQFWIYEATPAKVRRLSAEAYYAELARLNAKKKEGQQIRLWVVTPDKPYTETELTTMRHFLDEQIGRRYSVKNYVKNREGDGIHCAELTAQMLNQSGRADYENCYAISPAELFTLVSATHAPPQEFQLPAIEAEESWCQRSQRKWDGFCRWCGWSCEEAWSFCW